MCVCVLIVTGRLEKTARRKRAEDAATSMSRQTSSRWIARALILAALVASGFALREPISCFFFVRNLPDDVILYIRDASIRIMSLDGAGRCPIASRNEGQRLYMPIGSPDGRRVAFIIESERQRGAWVEIVNADGSERTRITSSELIVTNTNWSFNWIRSGLQIWSPDGERLVFAARTAGSDELTGALYLWASAEGVQPVPNSDGAQMGFWLPDGEHLLLITDISATRNRATLEIIQVDGGERRLLADDIAFHQLEPYIHWLPDGNMLYLSNSDLASLRRNVIVIDPQTGEQQRQIAFDRYLIRSLIPSPNGAQFAISAWDYRHERPTSGGRADDVVLVLDRDASSDADVRVLLRDANYIPGSEVIGWSPDGASLYYRKDSPLQRLTPASGEELMLDSGIDFRLWQRGRS